MERGRKEGKIGYGLGERRRPRPTNPNFSLPLSPPEIRFQVGPVTRRSRLVTSSRETVSEKKICLEREKRAKNSNLKKILVKNLLPIYLVSYLVSSRNFLSRDQIDETVSCLVSSRDLPSRSRLVTFVSLPALLSGGGGGGGGKSR